jgi:hypothetical protein
MNAKRTVFEDAFKEFMAFSRHYENQRSTVSNLILIMSGALLGLLTFDRITRSNWPICLFVGITGVFGLLFSNKNYQLSFWYLQQAKQCLKELNKLVPGPDINDRLDLAHNETYEHFLMDKSGWRRFLNPLVGFKRPTAELQLYWSALHAAIALLGFALFCYALSVAPPQQAPT